MNDKQKCNHKWEHQFPGTGRTGGQGGGGRTVWFGRTCKVCGKEQLKIRKPNSRLYWTNKSEESSK